MKRDFYIFFINFGSNFMIHSKLYSEVRNISNVPHHGAKSLKRFILPYNALVKRTIIKRQ